MPAECCKATWDKIPDDEPVFIIRGKDLLALGTISDWITRAEMESVNAEKIEGARKHFHWVQAFQVLNPERCKLPD